MQGRGDCQEWSAVNSFKDWEFNPDLSGAKATAIASRDLQKQKVVLGKRMFRWWWKGWDFYYTFLKIYPYFLFYWEPKSLSVQISDKAEQRFGVTAEISVKELPRKPVNRDSHANFSPNTPPSFPPTKMFLFVIVYKRLLSAFYLIILYEVIMRE